MSKGSKRRPQAVSEEQLKSNWDRIFPQKKDPRCSRPIGSIMAEGCRCPYCSGIIPMEKKDA